VSVVVNEGMACGVLTTDRNTPPPVVNHPIGEEIGCSMGQNGQSDARPSADRGAREHEIDRLLAAETGVHARQAALLFERRADRGWRAVAALGVAGHFALDLLVAHLDVFAPRDLVEHERRRDAVARDRALALAERVPVDAGLPRVDLLID